MSSDIRKVVESLDLTELRKLVMAGKEWVNNEEMNVHQALMNNPHLSFLLNYAMKVYEERQKNYSNYDNNHRSQQNSYNNAHYNRNNNQNNNNRQYEQRQQNNEFTPEQIEKIKSLTEEEIGQLDPEMQGIVRRVRYSSR